jgi:predicted HTH transcriptional regulator
MEYLIGVVNELRALPKETGWVEFKSNLDDPDDIGEYISALSNSAALHQRPYAYLVWGIEDETHNIIGTTFSPSSKKVGNEELENWLLRLLNPRIDFAFHEITVEEKKVVILEIDKAIHTPVRFKSTAYIRIGSYKKNLKEHSEKERALWRLFDQTPYEEGPARVSASGDDVLQLLDYPEYFELLGLPLPDNRAGILDRLQRDDVIVKAENGDWTITNLGAILFAKDLNNFKGLKRKAIRVIVYKGTTRVETEREQIGAKGYAVGFKGLINYINSLLPRNEVMGAALRKEVPMYPELAVRELVANALVHQDFSITGTGPMVEIFTNRMEIRNPGEPLIDPQRFLGSAPTSRNEILAAMLRRVGICEERGSGIEKVVFETELYQLPPPLFSSQENHTQAILFSAKPLNDMEKAERMRACYLHSCLRYVQQEAMTNASLRERFGIDKKNSAIASRIIKETLEAGLIRAAEEDMARRNSKYLPFWA